LDFSLQGLQLGLTDPNAGKRMILVLQLLRKRPKKKRRLKKRRPKKRRPKKRRPKNIPRERRPKHYY